jgi:hypothetical protein
VAADRAATRDAVMVGLGHHHLPLQSSMPAVQQLRHPVFRPHNEARTTVDTSHTQAAMATLPKREHVQLPTGGGRACQ